MNTSVIIHRINKPDQKQPPTHLQRHPRESRSSPITHSHGLADRDSRSTPRPEDLRCLEVVRS